MVANFQFYTLWLHDQQVLRSLVECVTKIKKAARVVRSQVEEFE